MRKIINFVIASAFILYIVYSYFKFHPYYFDSRYGVIFNNPGLIFKILLLVGVFVLGVSMYRLMSKKEELEEEEQSAVITKEIRPIGLFVYFNLFILLVLGMYFFDSAFAAHTSFFASIFAFFGQWLWIFFFLLLVVLMAMVVGYKVMTMFKLDFSERSLRLIMGAALGIAVWIFLLTLLGLFGWLTLWPIIIAAAIVSIAAFSVWKDIGKDLFWDKVKISFAYNNISWFLSTILVLIMTMNIIDLLRPFPIGWDDMGVYLNFPHLIANSGSLLAGYPNQAYMPISALGFIFANSATVGLFMSWLGGILATYALYVFGKRLINTEAGLLMATVMYSLPMVMHQSFGDMKLDMPLFFFIIMGFLALFLSIEKREEFKVALSVDKSLWVIAGFLLGTAMAIKVTTAIVIFALVVLIAWRTAGLFAGLTAFFFLHTIYFYNFVISTDISEPLKRKIALISLFLTVLFGALSLFKGEKILKLLKTLSVILLSMFVAFAPWAYKHWSETHSLGINALLVGGAAPSPQLNFTGAGVDLNTCVFTSGNEEMGRYMNTEEGIMHYVKLPWEMTMNLNQAGFYVDISFLFLALLPLLLLFWKPKEWPEFWQNVLLMFVVSWYFWLFVGSGVPWYGIGSFLFALLLIVRVKELFAKKVLWGNTVIVAAIVLSLFTVASLRESKFGSDIFLSYAFGLKNAAQVMDATSPNYSLIANTINNETSTPERPNYVYRIGTFITYFLNNNRERLYNDAQLDTFYCIDGDHKDDARTVDRLRKLGFHYMVYDTNTETIEKDPQGTLHQKTNRFKEFALKNLKVIAPTDLSRYNEGILFLEIPQM